MASYLWLIPLFPLAAAVVTAILGPRFLRQQSHWPCIIGVIVSCVLSVLVLLEVARGVSPSLGQEITWFSGGNVHVQFNVHADGLTSVMLVTVTFVSSLIAIFSVGYMSHEREHNAGYSRFFAEIALFVFSMTGLVLADNFILLYAFWEGVGLCSYLLIGFWFTKPSAAAAARKAFLVTRIGDAGMILGIALLWAGYLIDGPGDGRSALDYSTAFSWAGTLQNDHFMAVVALLFFCGAVGKSAQIPLYVWLPDAMEGPTPVSALIHAATMVTAGAYLVARSMPIFLAAPEWVRAVVATIGAFTALLAALIALTQNDLKRVLAYSTISQLGYMFLALGSANHEGLVLLAVTAAIFHLFTHAFFKALLFLAAGSVMHAMGNVIDMRRFSGLRHVMPKTHITFLCGALALGGFPLLSGFWSKDEILGVVSEASSHAYGNLYAVLFAVALITAGLTAFYTFRAYFRTFWGEVRIPPEAGEHAHESPLVMTVPLQILAIFALAVGFFTFQTHWIADLLRLHWMPAAFAPRVLVPEPEHMNWAGVLGGAGIALAGIGLAWVMYVRNVSLADQLARSMQAVYQLSLNKFHIDEIYYALIVRPLAGFASLCRTLDQYLVDSLVDLVA